MFLVGQPARLFAARPGNWGDSAAFSKGCRGQWRVGGARDERRRLRRKRSHMANASPPTLPVVLVVEDDPLMRLDAVDLLEKTGFVALEAETADEAIAIPATRKDIRILFTDIDMPGSMDGVKLAAIVRDRWPPIEVVLTSGHSRPCVDQIPLRGQFIAKPYEDSRLVAALRSYLP